MQVVQPKPTRLKPTLSRSFCRPAFVEIFSDDLRSRRERGLHHGLAFRPYWPHALRARSPAPIITFGFEVFVQDGDRGNDHVAIAEIVPAAPSTGTRLWQLVSPCCIPCPSKR